MLCTRYLATLVTQPTKLVPDDLLLRARCNMVHETAQELAISNPLVNKFSGAKFEEEREALFGGLLPSRLAALVTWLGKQEFFCGDLVTYCDFAAYHQLDLCRWDSSLSPTSSLSPSCQAGGALCVQ